MDETAGLLSRKTGGAAAPAFLESVRFLAEIQNLCYTNRHREGPAGIRLERDADGIVIARSEATRRSSGRMALDDSWIASP
jgi:hypothetical protein